MSDENIDINVNTVVDRESLDQLNADLTGLQDKAVDLEVDTSGLDDLSQSADDAKDNVGGLDESLDSVDGGGAKEAANDVSQVGTESSNAASAVTDLTDVLNLIGGAIATGGIIAGLDVMASSADSAHLSTVGMKEALDLDDSGLQTVNSAISEIANKTPLAKGEIRSMWSQFGIGGVKSAGTLQNLTEDITAFSVMGKGDITSLGNTLSKAFISESPQRAFRTLGIEVADVAAKSGMTTDAFNEMWAAATPEERAGVFDEYIRGSYDVVGLNQELSDSYTTLKQNFDDKMGKLATGFGNFILPLILPALGLLVDGLNFLGDVVNGLPDWAKMAGGVAILAAAFALIGIILMGTVIPAVLSAVIGFLNMIPPMLGVAGAAVPTTMGMAGVSAAFWSAAAAIWAAISPLLPFIAAALAVAAVVYLVGQYFGWWKDIPTMIEAIKAGVMRLWDAFINNKHVQAVIEWLKAAWQGVLDFLQPLFDFITTLWNNIFPPQDGGFDIINSIINLFGWLGNSIALLIGFIQGNWPLVSMAISPVMIPLQLIIAVLKLIYSNFGTVVSWFQSGASKIVGFISGLKAGWDSFASGVTSAYNTYVKPVLDAIASGVKTAQDFWNAVNGGAAGGSASGGLSAAGGILSSEDLQEINYPEQNYYEINLNGLVTEQSMIDELLRLIKIGKEQESMRT